MIPFGINGGSHWIRRDEELTTLTVTLTGESLGARLEGYNLINVLVCHSPSCNVVKLIHCVFPLSLVVHWGVTQQMYEVSGFRNITETFNFWVMFDFIKVLVFDILHITM